MGKTYTSPMRTHCSTKMQGHGVTNTRVMHTDEEGNFKGWKRHSCSDRMHKEIKDNKRFQRHMRQQEAQHLIDEALEEV